MLISYNWLKNYISDLPDTDKLTELITFKICEVESVKKLPNGDTIFDVKILPDRAHDLLSHRGMAREIAGILGLEIKDKEVQKNISSASTNLKIEIESRLCRRYMGRIARGVTVRSSPKWIVDLLESIGQRSINNIVDATNIILFGIGQPIHAFDLDKLISSKEEVVIKIRNAKKREKITTLDKREVELDEDILIIADDKDPLAIAGIKGGNKAEVDNNTKNIIIEVASFDSISIRKTAKRLGIATDSSKRYENDFSPILCDLAMQEITNLIESLCPEVKFEEVVEVYPDVPNKRNISFTREYISKILGVEIKDVDIERILKKYNYKFSHLSDVWEVEVPELRLDMNGPHDMAEEIGRVYGYDKIEGILPKLDFNQKDNDVWLKTCLAKKYLTKEGYKEVMTYALVGKGEVEIMASASDKNFLRTNLLDSLNNVYESNRLNSPILDLNEIKIFEIGTVFTKSDSSSQNENNIKEELHVAYLDKKNKIEMSLDKFVEQIPKDFISNNYKLESTSFKMWSPYPFIARDVAVWVPSGVESGEVYKVIKDNAGELLIKEPFLFDEFTKPASPAGGDAKTSYAYRLVFQSYERTLKDEEITEIMQRIYDKFSSLGWEIR